MYNQYGTFSSHQNYRDGDTFSFSKILSDEEFQLADPTSAKILDKVVEEDQKCSILDHLYRSSRFSATFFAQRSLHRFAKIENLGLREKQQSVELYLLSAVSIATCPELFYSNFLGPRNQEIQSYF